MQMKLGDLHTGIALPVTLQLLHMIAQNHDSDCIFEAINRLRQVNSFKHLIARCRNCLCLLTMCDGCVSKIVRLKAGTHPIETFAVNIDIQPHSNFTCILHVMFDDFTLSYNPDLNKDLNSDLNTPELNCSRLFLVFGIVSTAMYSHGMNIYMHDIILAACYKLNLRITRIGITAILDADPA